jgi:hypothetical protein
MSPHPIVDRSFACPDYNPKLALGYFSKQPSEKKEVIAQLAQHGITRAELEAKSAKYSAKPLVMFERMIASRDNEIRKRRKEAAQGQPLMRGESQPEENP